MAFFTSKILGYVLMLAILAFTAQLLPDLLIGQRRQLNWAQFGEGSDGENYFFGRRRGVGGDASCHWSAGRRPRDRRIKRQYNIVNHGWRRTTGGQQCGGVFR